MLEVRGLRAGYADLTVLWDIDLTVGPGELVGLVGANSAGKTTLLRSISGLHKPIERGEVSFEGSRIDRLPCHRVARLGMGLVSERTVFPNLSVAENLRLGQLARGDRRSSRFNEEAIYELFPELSSRKWQPARSLSGGERQMVAIGRALLGNPKLLLLDEPSTGIAPKVVHRILDTVKLLNREGVAVLLVDQYVEDALSMSQRAYVLEHGRIVAEDTGENLLSDPAVRRAYLGL
jgi:branched-chain amino acid transport system ATP-binding protein